MQKTTTGEREDEIRETLNGILDPCSVASGMPIGLVDMGIVHDVEITGSALRIVLLPTFPACRFVPIFESEVRKRLRDTALSVTVEVADPDVIWDESDIAPDTRRRLAEFRKRRRDEFIAQRPGSKLLPVVRLDGRA